MCDICMEPKLNLLRFSSLSPYLHGTCSAFASCYRSILHVCLHNNTYMPCISIDSLCLLDVPRKYQAALAEDGLPCVLIARNCSLMENTNATCKKKRTLKTGTITLSSRQSQKNKTNTQWSALFNSSSF